MSAKTARQSRPVSFAFGAARAASPARASLSAGAQIFLAGEVDAGGEEHADAGRGEAVMPAIDFAERSDDERRGDDARIDAEVENLEGVGAAEIVGFVE